MLWSERYHPWCVLIRQLKLLGGLLPESLKSWCQAFPFHCPFNAKQLFTHRASWCHILHQECKMAAVYFTEVMFSNLRRWKMKNTQMCGQTEPGKLYNGGGKWKGEVAMHWNQLDALTILFRPPLPPLPFSFPWASLCECFWKSSPRGHKLTSEQWCRKEGKFCVCTVFSLSLYFYYEFWTVVLVRQFSLSLSHLPWDFVLLHLILKFEQHSSQQRLNTNSPFQKYS